MFTLCGPCSDFLPVIDKKAEVTCLTAHFKDALKGRDYVAMFIHVSCTPHVVRGSWEMLRRCVLNE